jgi:NADPH-dependent curcumin reductase CurA
VQQYFVSEGADAQKVDPNIAPLVKFLGVLGMTGMTAYFGLLDVAQAKEGETVVVSGAAGAVGSIVGQIAKIKGCRVVGIAGGGETLNTVLPQMRRHGRIAICGAISQYNNTEAVQGPSNYMSLLVSRSRMEGFVVFDYAQQFGTAMQEMAAWMAAGKLNSKEHIETGIENFPEVLLKLFDGGNFGKLILQVDE